MKMMILNDNFDTLQRKIAAKVDITDSLQFQQLSPSGVASVRGILLEQSSGKRRH